MGQGPQALAQGPVRFGEGVDEDFLALPLSEISAAALTRARELGASHADVRVQRRRGLTVVLRDGALSSSRDAHDVGVAVRVIVDGVWGFAASSTLSGASAAMVAARAVEMARLGRPLVTDPVRLAPEPVHAAATWVGPSRTDPFAVDRGEHVAVLADWTRRLSAADVVQHVDASLAWVKEQKYYADLAGTTTVQQRVLARPSVTVVGSGRAGTQTMSSSAPPSARGFEYVLGEGWDVDGELAQLPESLAEKVDAPSVEPGTYTLVIDPTNLWLTIHESVGHATEYDRALGYEAAYAGTSFVTAEAIGTLRYGSELMTVTGDRTAPHGCATLGYDDEGVATTSWDIVKDGVLVGVQLDRRMARSGGFGRSNGCAYADSALSAPMQRMANVSLAPAAGARSVEDLIAGVEDGLYVVGDKSWSIDMQRYNFQFTAQRFHRIRSGRLVGQVNDAAYQGSTPAFWSSLVALGGEDTYLLGGAANCGKGQPGQLAWVSHGCPATVFEGVRVLNTREEGGR